MSNKTTSRYRCELAFLLSSHSSRIAIHLESLIGVQHSTTPRVKRFPRSLTTKGMSRALHALPECTGKGDL